MTYMDNYNMWLDSPLIDDNTKEELLSISNNDEEIKDRFSSTLSFGTAGLRGLMRSGLNGMNIYTVRHATQGLADFIKSCNIPTDSSVTISFDSRHNSSLFAKEAAKVLAGNDIHVNLFESLRPTPELSFAIRETNSIAGINITASHNTKEYNGYKVYWNDGAQISPSQAREISNYIEKKHIFLDIKNMDFTKAIEDGIITYIGKEIDELYKNKVLEQSVGKKYIDLEGHNIKIVYTPFHGTGYSLIPEVLKSAGFKNIIPVSQQMIIDGDFPTVKSPNPENIQGFKMAIDLAKKNNADIIIGTDPDGDRCGVVSKNSNGEYEILTGNQIGILILNYLIQMKKEAGKKQKNLAVVKSLVSSQMANKICQANDITIFETLTGFKYIGEKIKEFEESGKYEFLFGFEESNGYLLGTYARDKDAILASMIISEMTCYYKYKGMNLSDALLSLYEEYGFFKEKVISIEFNGFDANKKMKSIMTNIRNNPPCSIGLKVNKTKDFLDTRLTNLPSSNMLYYELDKKCSVIVRPSGTEPKIKLYVMVCGDTRQETNNLEELITKESKKIFA